MSSSRRRHCPCSPSATSPLDVDDLLSEILFRLPPESSSLPRVSAVCKSWRRLVSDPSFVHHFRIHHRRNPPILGCFDIDHGFSFQPTLEAPNRVPPERFSLQFSTHFRPLGCRHGLVLFLDASLDQVLVWDPVTGEQHRLAVPPGFPPIGDIHGAVVRAAGGAHFRVVLVGGGKQVGRALARVYSSETGVWGSFLSTWLPSEDPTMDFSSMPAMVFSIMPAVLVGNSLCWSIFAGSLSTLEFDLDRQSLVVTSAPVNFFGHIFVKDSCNVTVMRAEGGGMGFLVSDSTAQLWKKHTDSVGVVWWVPEKTIEFHKLLPLKSENERPQLVGFAEENNVAFFSTLGGVFMVQLESLEVKKLFGASIAHQYQPLETVYTPGI
uniref:Uncharacterized protein n=1 Tax=Avena sativa TaxID=4498 RepID=A0ACD5Z8V8_AVESA